MGNAYKLKSINIMSVLFSTFLILATSHIALAQEVEYETLTHANYTFSVSGSQLPWAQAVEACKTRGQTLATVEDPEKDDILVELFSEHKHTDVTLKGNSWISATEVREGVWHWATLDKPTYYTRWFMDGQPDDTENLNCVYLASEWMLYWRDANCSASMYFICEGEVKPQDSGASSVQFISVPLLTLCFLTFNLISYLKI